MRLESGSVCRIYNQISFGMRYGWLPPPARRSSDTTIAPACRILCCVHYARATFSLHCHFSLPRRRRLIHLALVSERNFFLCSFPSAWAVQGRPFVSWNVLLLLLLAANPSKDSSSYGGLPTPFYGPRRWGVRKV